MFGRFSISVKAALKGEIRLLNFLAVGALNTVFGYSVFALMLWLGLHFSLAIAIATIAGTLFNFKSVGTLVFGSYDNSRIISFIFVYAVVYCVNVVSVAGLQHLGFNAYQGGILMALPLALLAYRLNCKYVFKYE